MERKFEWGTLPPLVALSPRDLTLRGSSREETSRSTTRGSACCCRTPAPKSALLSNAFATRSRRTRSRYPTPPARHRRNRTPRMRIEVSDQAAAPSLIDDGSSSWGHTGRGRRELPLHVIPPVSKQVGYLAGSHATYKGRRLNRLSGPSISRAYGTRRPCCYQFGDCPPVT